jgi:hypothetical protein
MKVIKALVDELPSGCVECRFMGRDSQLGYCPIAGEELETSYCTARPDWCPLVLESENKE